VWVDASSALWALLLSRMSTLPNSRFFLKSLNNSPFFVNSRMSSRGMTPRDSSTTICSHIFISSGCRRMRPPVSKIIPAGVPSGTPNRRYVSETSKRLRNGAGSTYVRVPGIFMYGDSVKSTVYSPYRRAAARAGSNVLPPTLSIGSAPGSINSFNDATRDSSVVMRRLCRNDNGDCCNRIISDSTTPVISAISFPRFPSGPRYHLPPVSRSIMLVVSLRSACSRREIMRIPSIFISGSTRTPYRPM